MRLNFSHATDEEVKLRLSSIAKSQGAFPLDDTNQLNRTVLLDTKGPEIRTGGLAAVDITGDVKAKIQLFKGNDIILTTNESRMNNGDENTLYVNYDSLGKTVSKGKIVLLDDGAVALTVKDVQSNGDVLCHIENDGEIASRRGVNLPGMSVNLPAMSTKDRDDIRYGIEKDMDFVAASFVRKAEDIEEIRAHIEACHAEFWPVDHPKARIIAKIESTEALENLDEITAAADGIMVARGDLGVEVPLEEVVIWQKEMVTRCIAAASGKPVVVATQMLESMQKNPRPTRAEVADVTNAVIDRADAVMLSGESANGKFPVQALEMMTAIIKKTESWMPPYDSAAAMTAKSSSVEDVMAASCVFSAEKINAGGIVVVGDASGDVTRLLSKYRPSMPVLVVLDSVKVAKQLNIHRSVFPTLLPYDKAIPAAIEQGLFDKRDHFIFVNAGGANGIEMSINQV
jgi:pyruvate kinase